jgi:ribulose-5-phosphate 4-epimerase/fuculose-1-phosphate aldolase
MMATPHPMTSPPPRWCSPDEWQARVRLAATYRVFHMLGWTEMIFNHITLRLPGPDKHFLINPFGLAYDEVTASNLVRIDADGNIHGPSEFPINPAGFIVHSAIHRHVDDAHCVMHTHASAGLAVACMEGGLSHTNFYSAQLRDMVAYHAFEGITVHADEQQRLLASLGDKRLLILRNHGLLSHGRTLAHAFVLLWTLTRACEIQVMTDSMRGNVLPISAEVIDRTTRDALHFALDTDAGEDVLAALIRRVDRIDPSYKE